MNSSTTPDFWACYHALAPEVQSVARSAFRRWLADPRHPSLRFKKAGGLWSVRVGHSHRALAMLDGDTWVWFWIGEHDEYERLLAGQ